MFGFKLPDCLYGSGYIARLGGLAAVLMIAMVLSIPGIANAL